MSTNKAPQQKKAPVIQINQEVLHNNLSDYVRKNLEDVLNELPDAEADRLCHAKRYERNAERASICLDRNRKFSVFSNRCDRIAHTRSIHLCTISI